MRLFFKVVSATAFSCGMIATSALADVTANDVWKNLEKIALSNGYIFSEAPRPDGDDVVFDAVTLSFQDTLSGPVPGSGRGFDVSLDLTGLTFRGQSDGSVDVILPRQMPVRVTVPAGSRTPARSLIGMQRLDSPTIRATGTADAIAYSYAFDRLLTTLANNEATDLPNMDIRVDMLDVRGSLLSQDGGDQIGSGEVKKIDFEQSIHGPEGRISRVSGVYNDVVMANTFQLVEGVNTLRAALERGQSMNAVYSFGRNRTVINDRVPDGEMSLEVSSRVGELRITSNQAKTAMDILSQDFDIDISSPDLGFPVKIAGEKMQLGFGVPALTSGETEEFNVKVDLSDVTVGEPIWAMVDPNNALSRAPMSLALDFDGTAKRPSQTGADTGSELQMETIETVNVNRLVLSALGAVFTGDGRFSFDHTDTQTYPDFPRPMGKANLRVTGFNAALESMIQAGLLKPEHAMMPRMFIGMFARPVGDDIFETDVQFGKSGDLRVNGQRVK